MSAIMASLMSEEQNKEIQEKVKAIIIKQLGVSEGEASAAGAAAIAKEAPTATSRAARVLSGAFISSPSGVLTV